MTLRRQLHEQSTTRTNMANIRTKRKLRKNTTSSMAISIAPTLPLILLAITGTIITPVRGWGNGDNTRYSGEYLFSQSGKTQWLYGNNDDDAANTVAVSVQGCVWGFVEDNEDAGCLEDSSEDGTYYWYRMSNCRRAQVAYTVYASGNGYATCNSNTYVNTFVTKTYSLAAFVDLISEYDPNPVITEDDIDGLPEGCEEDDNGNYIAVGCSSSGGFTIDTFSDAYCQAKTGTYQSLSSLDTLMGYMSCHTCSDAGGDGEDRQLEGDNGGGSGDQNDNYQNLCQAMVGYSESCSPADYDICLDVDGSKTSSYKKFSSSSGGSSGHHSVGSIGMSVSSKIKYTLGSAFLLSSFVMFLGILSTNRRKRRALIQRKFRQSAKGYDEEAGGASRRDKSRSRSKSTPRDRDRSSSRGASRGASRSASRGASRSRRSKSRSRRESSREGGTFA